MGNTARGYVYPEGTDLADVPADMRAALESVDADVETVETLATTGDTKADANAASIADLQAKVDHLFGRYAQTGVAYVSHSDSSQSDSNAVTFPVAFQGVPRVVATGRPFSSRRYNITVLNVSTTGFTIWSDETSGTSSNDEDLAVHWIAVGSVDPADIGL